ncbi:hypothetical protein HanXRQr2_Chr10g0442271 [Helianthus annuus]|uniref:Uncharacterized protein n=1 Tax=Helianthus annuus TaxID=4232 RepID=A0A9K3N4U6_HELAN|nr:hypothetical protein HanXRQr2_Chr10g0442271 [Helianthus annuus]KAJ0883882.1 hypothetical protein HanPSC8_Chr10g0426941 [Helianthus annuus]
MTRRSEDVPMVTRWTTEWKAVVVVCFLWIIVRPDFIHPQGNWLI